jgi:hypothetical protein
MTNVQRDPLLRQIFAVLTRQTSELSFLVDRRSLPADPSPCPEPSAFRFATATAKYRPASPRFLQAGLAACLVVLALGTVSAVLNAQGDNTGDDIGAPSATAASPWSTGNRSAGGSPPSAGPLPGKPFPSSTRSAPTNSRPDPTQVSRHDGPGPDLTGTPSGHVMSRIAITPPGMTSTRSDEPTPTEPTTDRETTRAVRGSIRHPSDGETVQESSVAAIGTISDLGQQLRLFCLVRDEAGNYFPYLGVVQEGSWSCDARIGPATISRPMMFTLQLRTATPPAVDEIHRRQEDAEDYATTGLGPQLPEGLSLVDEVTITRTQ